MDTGTILRRVSGGFAGMLTGSAASQADLAQKQLQQRALARSKEELGLPVRPKREARLPLQLSEAQLECYRDVLARRFDVLADPKRPRHSAQRTSEMRALCAELRKVDFPAQAFSHVALSKRHQHSHLRQPQCWCRHERVLFLRVIITGEGSLGRDGSVSMWRFG